MTSNLTDRPEDAAQLMRVLPADVRNSSIAAAGNVIDGRRRFDRRRPTIRVNYDWDGCD